MRHKLGLIVPYRLREEQLKEFILRMTEYLKDIRFEIIIVNQDNAKQFNRGMLLNIGFLHAEKMHCTYVIFHDVDMLPVNVDYSYSDIPLHLATDVRTDSDEKEREMFEEYFGGVTLFPVETFRKINGYSNKYWGWGYEDTDLLYRCVNQGIDLDIIKIKNMGKPSKAIRFNGIDSYIKVRNIYDLDYNTTFFISFYPDDIICDHTKENDYYTIFSIPGYDTSISYNSFSRYSFLTFDEDRESLYINTKIKKNYKTNICVTVDNDNKVIRMFQDGHFVGETKITNTLLSYLYERFFYLGVGQPERQGDERFFKGYLTSFASYSKVLSDEEILEISENEHLDLRTSFGVYNSGDSLTIYFDANKIENYEMKNLVNKIYNGKMINCEIVDLDFEEYRTVHIPHRRQSVFQSQKHEENGFFNNKWKSQDTRWNQLRFHNEIFKNEDLVIEDGLSTLEFVEHDKIKYRNLTEINVGL